MKVFSSAPFETLRREYILLGALIVGAGLRLYQLPGQLLLGDEWHAIFAAHNGTYYHILSHFGISDYSIPIALYFKFLSSSVGLNELVIRAPFFLSGLLSILIFPILVRNYVGRFTSNLFGWLLALSPPLIFYSRFARPYAISLLFGFIAVIIFFRWWGESSWRYAIQYMLFALASAYFLLVNLPFVLGPFIFFSVFCFFKSQKSIQNPLKKLSLLALPTLLALGCLLALPLYIDFNAISSKAASQLIQVPIISDAFTYLAGMTTLWMVITMGGLIIMGLKKAYRNYPFFASYLLALSLIQAITIFFLRPVGTNAPHILARYLLILLPALLIFASSGVEAVTHFFHDPFKKIMRVAIPVCLCLAVFLGGPVMVVSHRPNNATALTMLLQALEGRKYDRILKHVSEFYQTLGAHPPASLIIVEAPFVWQANHLPLYQEIHRQNMLMGFMEGLCPNKEGKQRWMAQQIKDLHTIVDLSDRGALLATGADFVVFHKDLQNEIRVPLKAYTLRRNITDCIKQYRRWFGKPIFVDEDIVVFEVPKR